jgi:prepilin-type N-terminal cleavage/methylation domain-containing protein
MRRAFTLIEMIVVITVGAALMGIAVSLLLVLFRTERIGRAHGGESGSIQQLADQFRRDVHAAADVTVHDKDRQRCQFALTPDCSVQYTMAPDGISREEQLLSRNMRRELYALPKDTTLAVDVDRAASPAVVTMTIQPKDASRRPGNVLRVEAVLGRDLRFIAQRKEGK